MLLIVYFLFFFFFLFFFPDENRYFGIIKKHDFFEMSEMIQKNLTDCMMARNRYEKYFSNPPQY